ncbi:MAG: type I-E CRISPR-associated protein Cse2/CasB [Proteobacteria bacterium]|nr:type I-E CRISPR-associated protein Cse2/CasB [Pseudomonadota bacterium]
MSFALIDNLNQLARRDDRAALAALRRGLSPDSVAAAYPYVVPFLPSDAKPFEERAYVLAAALFGTHPVAAARSLATALRTVQERRPGSDSLEARFVALLDAHIDDLPTHLRHAISLLKAHELGLDWNNLLETLLHWEHEARWVQRQWARDFWGVQNTATSTKEPTK